ncbi:MAG: diguanylate cyclase [Silicimonas sp.]|nr:diguanylate cyclase [Silicimonas sp.]
MIIDSVPTNRIRLAAALEAAHYDVVAVEAPQHVLRMPGLSPDLVLCGLHQEPPLRALHAIKTAGLSPETPVIFLDADASPLRRLQALKAGAREFMSRKIPDALLLARVRGLLREGEAERECARRRMTANSFGFADAPAAFDAPARVACVISPGVAPNLPDMLAAALPHRLDVLDMRETLRDAARGEDPDAYLVAPGTDDDALDAILPELRMRSHSRHAPVLVLHPDGDHDMALHALNLGASDIASDTSSGDELSLRIDEMLRRKRLRDQLRQTDEQSYRLAATDALTGLYNRRYAEAYLADLMMREHDSEQGHVVMLVDLDHFKEVNDTHGHGAGDLVLRQVAERLRDNLRAGDLVARYGGEEFLVVLPDASAEEGAYTAERLRRAVCGVPVGLENGTDIPVTASIGVGLGVDAAAVRPMLKTGTFDVALADPGVSFSRMLEAADSALYRAKNSGRNRVELANT